VAGGEAHGLEIVVHFDGLPDQGPADVHRLLPGPAGHLGVVVVTAGMQGIALAGADTDIPIVAVDPTEPAPSDWMTVGATNWSGAKTATDHLLRLGHRRIAWMGPNTGGPLAERLHGYRAALQEAGVSLPPDYEQHGDFTFESGKIAAEALLRLPERPTAIMCGNDEIAIGAMHAARAAELVVPRDLSVVGFDDTPQAAWATPQLTTVRQPLADMGRMSVSMILGAARGHGPESRHIQLATSLTLRESPARPAGDRRLSRSVATGLLDEPPTLLNQWVDHDSIGGLAS
jgi:LacI family transcriptional regulator